MAYRVIVEIEINRPKLAKDEHPGFTARGNMIVAGFPDEACALEMGDVVVRALYRTFGKRLDGSIHIEAEREHDEVRPANSIKS